MMAYHHGIPSKTRTHDLLSSSTSTSKISRSISIYYPYIYIHMSPARCEVDQDVDTDSDMLVRYVCASSTIDSDMLVRRQIAVCLCVDRYWYACASMPIPASLSSLSIYTYLYTPICVYRRIYNTRTLFSCQP